MQTDSGTRLGRYELLEKIGAGGMGEVFRARDHDLHRDVRNNHGFEVQPPVVWLRVEVSVDALKGLTLRARGGSDPRIIIDY
ncbi:MAG TPA: hypothetical protein VMN81_10845 [Vicinamibacterales bacterium]|nr:hypothetical protein [Vicinamibacterales bacterium]